MTPPEPPIVLLVCGGRDFADDESLCHALDKTHQDYNVGILVTGGAAGADKLAGIWARDRRIPTAVVAPYWEYGRSAGPVRNRAMLLLRPSLVVAFPGGRGTEDMVTAARAAGIRVNVWS